MNDGSRFEARGFIFPDSANNIGSIQFISDSDRYNIYFDEPSDVSITPEQIGKGYGKPYDTFCELYNKKDKLFKKCLTQE